MRIIRLRDVIRCTGLSRSTIYKFINEGMFPKSVPLGGRAVGWVEAEVGTWMLGRLGERDARSSGGDLCSAAGLQAGVSKRLDQDHQGPSFSFPCLMSGVGGATTYTYRYSVGETLLE